MVPFQTRIEHELVSVFVAEVSEDIPGKWGLWIAITMTLIGGVVSWFLGIWGFCATILAIICAWAYSAEPIRLKRSGIIGPGNMIV